MIALFLAFGIQRYSQLAERNVRQVSERTCGAMKFCERNHDRIFQGSRAVDGLRIGWGAVERRSVVWVSLELAQNWHRISRRFGHRGPCLARSAM